MTRFVTNLVPAAMRFAALTAQQGPAYAVATALTPFVAALLQGAQRSFRPERQFSMSKLISFRALAVVVLITLAAPVAAEPAITAPAVLRPNLRLRLDPDAIHDPLPRLSGFAPASPTNPWDRAFPRAELAAPWMAGAPITWTLDLGLDLGLRVAITDLDDALATTGSAR